jgi:hypothetical protein
MLLFLSFLVLLYWFLVKPLSLKPIYLNDKNNIQYVIVHPAIPIIEKINENNSKIKNVSTEADIKLKMKININLSATLSYEKDKKFNIVVNSATGKEMIIGSNDEFFWYWSKRDNPVALNYSKHEDLTKAKLKTPLHPTWLIECLNFEKINTEKTTIAKFNNFYVVLEERNSASNEKVTKITLIDPEKERIIGHYLYNSKDKLVASAEISAFVENKPTSYLIIWYEEGIIMEWKLKNTKYNQEIKKETWDMPNITPKIDISKTRK